MSEDTDREPSAAELRRRLADIPPPFTRDEYDTVIAIIREWKFQQMLKDEKRLEAEAKRARWPLLGIVVSVSTSVLLWLATFIVSHWPFGGGPKP